MLLKSFEEEPQTRTLNVIWTHTIPHHCFLFVRVQEKIISLIQRSQTRGLSALLLRISVSTFAMKIIIGKGDRHFRARQYHAYEGTSFR